MYIFKMNLYGNGMDDVGLATRLAIDLSNIDASGIQRLNDFVKEYVDTLKVSDFENDSGYLTIDTLPIYEGGVE